MEPIRLPIIKHTNLILSKEDDHDSELIIDIEIPDNLIYFDGHFDDFPIVPGVVQIDWIAKSLYQLLPTSLMIQKIEALKFMHPIRPKDKCKIKMYGDFKKEKVTFQFYNKEKVLTKGRLVVGSAK